LRKHILFAHPYLFNKTKEIERTSRARIWTGINRNERVFVALGGHIFIAVGAGTLDGMQPLKKISKKSIDHVV
jgi:hypothetical protein